MSRRGHAARGSRPSAAIGGVLADRRGVRAAGSGGWQSRAGHGSLCRRGSADGRAGQVMEQDTVFRELLRELVPRVRAGTQDRREP